MNRFAVLAAITCLAITGCGKKAEPAPAEAASAPKAGVRIDEATPEAPPPPAAPGTPQADGAAPPAEEQKPEKITPLTEREVAMLNYAVYKFREETGRLPKNLQEMVGKTLPRMPQIHPSEKLNYDASTGLIKVEKVK